MQAKVEDAALVHHPRVIHHTNLLREAAQRRDRIVKLQPVVVGVGVHSFPRRVGAESAGADVRRRREVLELRRRQGGSQVHVFICAEFTRHGCDRAVMCCWS